MVYADVRFFIQEETNLKVDKMGMLNSVEVRVPFQDQHIVEFVLNIPMARKIKFGTLKYILKKSVSDILPPPVLQRKKWGFFPPTSSWLRGGLKHLVFDVLSKENVERVGIFNFKQVERIVKAHIGMQQYFARELWLLLCFHLWWLTYLNK
jgi:asparagine synthase (glutamine-hydrolysing)